MTLEAEISELQRENARVESQMIKLKSDINAMESHLGQSEKVSVKIHRYALSCPGDLKVTFRSHLDVILVLCAC